MLQFSTSDLIFFLLVFWVPPIARFAFVRKKRGITAANSDGCFVFGAGAAILVSAFIAWGYVEEFRANRPEAILRRTFGVIDPREVRDLRIEFITGENGGNRITFKTTPDRMKRIVAYCSLVPATKSQTERAIAVWRNQQPGNAPPEGGIAYVGTSALPWNQECLVTDVAGESAWYATFSTP